MAATSDDVEMSEEFQVTQPAVFKGWTKDEKYNLLIGLKHNGFKINLIQKRVGTKTEAEIEDVIKYCKEELKVRNTTLPARVRRKLKPKPQIPLAKWAELLTETYNYKDLQTELATAVRTIADFEEFPHPSTTSNIDFKKIYHYIADAMEGKPLPDDAIAADVLNHCMMESAAMSRAFIPKNELQAILGGFTQSPHAGTHIVPRPTKDGGLAALRTLATQSNYNPLNIPEQYLIHAPSYTARVPDSV